MTIDEVMEQFPVTRDQVTVVLASSARSLDTPVSGGDADPALTRERLEPPPPPRGRAIQLRKPALAGGLPAALENS